MLATLGRVIKRRISSPDLTLTVVSLETYPGCEKTRVGASDCISSLSIGVLPTGLSLRVTSAPSGWLWSSSAAENFGDRTHHATTAMSTTIAAAMPYRVFFGASF